ncbi:MAG: metallophosphoesterase [Methanobacteriaceae archaeon]|jgi:hypothetical protein|nr:metallophosphoesterase [Methanobacteriaceae archaeon]
MKILEISDVHSRENENLNKYLNNNDIDLLIISGDITNFGPLDFVDTFIKKLLNHDCNVIAIPGNCDVEGVCNAIKDSGALCTHNNVVVYENLAIFGYGGSNPTPFDTPGEVEDDKIYEDISNLISENKKIYNDDNKIKILLTHAPPFNSKADLVENGDHVGSHAILDIIKNFNFDINLCGHIHEAKSIDKINGTIVANPGILENNGAILINIDENNEYSIEIISL